MAKKEKIKVKKQKKGVGFIRSVLLCACIIFLLFATPLTGFIISFIPKEFIRTIMSNYYQDITLDQSGKKLTEPIKYDKNAPYPVLGRESGICFKFYSTIGNENINAIDKDRIQKAVHGEAIAEIIVMDNKKEQYSSAEVTVSTGSENTKDHKIKEFTVICQKIGRSEIYIPKDVIAIYIRPLKAFRPAEIVWVTQKSW